MPAKPGNTNALKHGLYAKRFSKDQIKELRDMPEDDLRQEIAMLRTVIDTLYKQTRNVDDSKELAAIANSLSLGVTTLITAIRNHSLLTGNYSPLDDALAAALDAEPFYITTSEKAEGIHD